MLFNSALLSTFLFASAVLADRPREYSPQFLNLERSTDADSTFVDNWCGAVLQKGTFESVNATFTVPHVKDHPSGAVGTATVSIDGIVCADVMLRAGVQFSVTDKGPSYQAWSQWYPDTAHMFDISISPGDVVQVSVGVLNSESKLAVATIENHTTRKAAFQFLTSSTPLCMHDAAWLVVYDMHGPFPHFGEVNFYDAQASGNGKTYTPKGATIYDIKQGNHPRTKTSVHGSSVTIEYV